MTDAIQQGDVSLTLKDQIAYIEFFHPLSNSLPGKVLAKLADDPLMPTTASVCRTLVVEITLRPDWSVCRDAPRA